MVRECQRKPFDETVYTGIFRVGETSPNLENSQVEDNEKLYLELLCNSLNLFKII